LKRWRRSTRESQWEGTWGIARSPTSSPLRNPPPPAIWQLKLRWGRSGFYREEKIRSPAKEQLEEPSPSIGEGLQMARESWRSIRGTKRKPQTTNLHKWKHSLNILLIFIFIYLCTSKLFFLKLLQLICHPFGNKHSCLTVRPCHMHCGLTLKTSITLQQITFFD